MSVDDILLDTEERMEKALASAQAATWPAFARAGPTRDWSTRCASKSTARRRRSSNWPRSGAPEPTQIVIRPFDPGTLKDIEKAIQASGLGFNPQNDGRVIRINIPPLSTEVRRKLVGRIKELTEEAKVSVRNVRRDGNKAADQEQKDKSTDRGRARPAQGRDSGVDQEVRNTGHRPGHRQRKRGHGGLTAGGSYGAAKCSPLARKVSSMRHGTLWTVVYGVLWLATNNDAVSADEPPGDAAARVARPGVLVIAHRGDSKRAPENTLPAFSSAIGAGADFVELDYFHSADGVPVVIHDSELDRTTNSVRLWGEKKIKVVDKTVAELKRLDAGDWYGKRFAGTTIPTLAEALDTIQAGSMTLIERKGGEPAACVALLRQKKIIDQVVVQSFDWDYLAGCHQIEPQLVTAALGQKELTAEKLDQIAKTGARVVAWDEKEIDAAAIAAIHARGWKAWVYTVDRPERIGELVRAKIDGIITNRPAETRSTVQGAHGGS